MHDDFMQMFQEAPMLENLARDVGIINKDGQIPGMRQVREGVPSFAGGDIIQPTGLPAAHLPQQYLPPGGVVLPSPRKRPHGGDDAMHDMAVALGQQVGQRFAKARYAGYPEGAPSGKRARRSMGGRNADGNKTKGLRHFSMRVCKKVEEKGTTTYNEVAEELVIEYKRETEAQRKAAAANPGGAALPAPKIYDEKNIRRRVYDALNVLMAMDIISKEKKEIRWRGLPSNARHDLEMLRREKDARVRSIARKSEQLQELLLQYIAFDNIARRNKERAAEPKDAKEDAAAPAEAHQLQLPFIVVTTPQQTMIQCEMAENRESVFFNFDGPFEVHDDMEVIKRMQLHTHLHATARANLPPHMMEFLPEAVRKAAEGASS